MVGPRTFAQEEKNNLSQMNDEKTANVPWNAVESRRRRLWWQQKIDYSIFNAHRGYFLAVLKNFFIGKRELFQKKTYRATGARPVNNMRTFHSLVNLDSCQILSINYCSGYSERKTRRELRALLSFFFNSQQKASNSISNFFHLSSVRRSDCSRRGGRGCGWKMGKTQTHFR